MAVALRIAPALLLLAGCAVPPRNATVPAEPPVVDGSALRPGDRIDVTVVGQPDLSGTFDLDRDGMLTMPLIGAVDAYRLSPDDLEDHLILRFGDGYLRAPRVHVATALLRPFFIVGEVERPGSYVYRPGMTVAAAIREAGGTTAADESLDVVVTPGGRAHATRVVGLEAPLSPGDIVELKERAG